MPELNTDLSSGTTSAKRNSWREANPTAILKRVIDDNPDASYEVIRDRTRAIIRGREKWWSEQLETIFEYWCWNNYRRLSKAPPLTPEERAAQKAASDAAAAAIRQQIEAKIGERVQIALLEMILPSGKPLRESTREELVDLGGWAQRVAEEMQPGQTVADAGMTEERLRDLYGQGEP